MDRIASEYLVDEAAQTLCEMLPRDPAHARQVAARVAQKAGVPLAWRPGPKTAVAASLALCGAIVIAAAGRLAVASPEPPHRNIHVELVDPVVGPDDPLEIRFTSHRTRLCKADVDRVIMDAEGRTVHAVRQTGIGQAVTKEPVMRIIRVPMPYGLPPGKYTYRSIIYSDCGGDLFAEPSPDLVFEIRG